MKYFYTLLPLFALSAAVCTKDAYRCMDPDENDPDRDWYHTESCAKKLNLLDSCHCLGGHFLEFIVLEGKHKEFRECCYSYENVGVYACNL